MFTNSLVIPMIIIWVVVVLMMVPVGLRGVQQALLAVLEHKRKAQAESRAAAAAA